MIDLADVGIKILLNHIQPRQLIVSDAFSLKTAADFNLAKIIVSAIFYHTYNFNQVIVLSDCTHVNRHINYLRLTYGVGKLVL